MLHRELLRKKIYTQALFFTFLRRSIHIRVTFTRKFFAFELRGEKYLLPFCKYWETYSRSWWAFSSTDQSWPIKPSCALFTYSCFALIICVRKRHLAFQFFSISRRIFFFIKDITLLFRGENPYEIACAIWKMIFLWKFYEKFSSVSLLR